MDNLTHTLAGAALGEAGLKRLSGLGMAALMIGANLPDLDAIAIPFGANLTFRRGWTHGPFAMLLLPILLTGLLIAWDRLQSRRGTRPPARAPIRWGQLLLLSAIAVLSHPALDWLNTYGVRLLMPFSEQWFYGDSIFIIDPWIWLTLGAGVLLSRRLARHDGRAGARASRVAVAAVGAYIVLMLAGSRAAATAASRYMVERGEGRAPLRVMAGPVPVHPLRRQLIYDMGPHYRFGMLRWSPAPTIELDASPLPVNRGHPAVQTALADREVQDFLYWSRFPFFVVDEDGAAVRVGDARFADRGDGWGFSVRVLLPLQEEAP